MCYDFIKHLPKNKRKQTLQRVCVVLCCQTDDVPNLLAFCLFACSAMSHFQSS